MPSSHNPEKYERNEYKQAETISATKPRSSTTKKKQKVHILISQLA